MQWMTCGTWMQSPSVVVSWSDMGLFNSMFYASGPSSFQSVKTDLQACEARG